jgi:hypothetical protein
MDAIVKYPNRWTAGISGNPNGRPVGSRTAFSNAFLRDLAESWAEHGKATMVHTAKANPEVYFATCARLIPKDVQLTIEQTTPRGLDQSDIAAMLLRGFRTKVRGDRVAGFDRPLVYQKAQRVPC